MSPEPGELLSLRLEVLRLQRRERDLLCRIAELVSSAIVLHQEHPEALSSSIGEMFLEQVQAAERHLAEELRRR